MGILINLNINLFLEIIDDFQGGIGCSEVRGGKALKGGLSFQGGIGTPLPAMELHRQTEERGSSV